MVSLRSPRVPVRPIFSLAGLAAGAVALAVALPASSVLGEVRWERVWELGGWLVALLGFGLLCARLLRADPARALLCLILPLALLLYGPRACLAVALIALLAASLGGRLGVEVRTRPGLASIVGLAVISAVAGWLQGAKGIDPGPLLLILLVAQWLLRGQLGEVYAGYLNAARSVRVGGRIGLLPLALLIAALLVSGHPTLHFDDLAYHAALPTQLLELGYNRLDARSQIWALAPWSGDVLQALAAVLAGADARGALNGLWWLLLALAVVEVLPRMSDSAAQAEHDAGRGVQIALLLIASLPMSWMLLAGMQTELPTAAVLLALLGLLQSPAGDAAQSRRQAVLLGVLVGLLLGLKVSNVVFVAALAVAALISAPRRTLLALPIAVPVAALIGGSSYVYAWWISGNPLLPLFNSWFGSTLVGPEDLVDLRYRAGLDFSDFHGALFDSSRYLESWDGVAGFQWLLLATFLPLGLTKHKRSEPGAQRQWLALPWCCVAVLAGALLLFAQMQYLRYLYPAMVVGSIAIAIGLQRCLATAAARWQLRAALHTALASCIALNLCAIGSVHWQLREGLTPRGLWSERAEQDWINNVAPELALVRNARELDGQANLLLADPDHPYIASGAGRSYTTAWYDPQLQALAARCNAQVSGACWRSELVAHGFGWVITRQQGATPLTAALDGWAQLAGEQGSARLFRLPEMAGGRDLYSERGR